MVFIMVNDSAGKARKIGKVGLGKPPLLSNLGKIPGKGRKRLRFHTKSIKAGLTKYKICANICNISS